MCQAFEELANERARKVADISRAEGISIGGANTKKKYEARIAEMQTDLEKYKAALKP